MSSPASTREERPPGAAGLKLCSLALGLIVCAITVASVPGWNGVLGATLAVVMLLITLIDYRTFRIPDCLNMFGFTLALVHAALQEPDRMLLAIANATVRGAALALVFLVLRNGYSLLRGREGLGLGDVKLAAVAGAWLDWIVIPIAIQLAAFGALTAYLIQHFALGRTISGTSRLPFGAFFAPAIWISWMLERLLIDMF